MKRMLVATSIAALALLGSAGTASAAADLEGPDCFGGVHKAVNAGLIPGVANVGQLVKAAGGGQAKNAAATGICGG
jgi:hypothetical protein